MRIEIEKLLESRMRGNMHVRFGVGAGVRFPGPHHAAAGAFAGGVEPGPNSEQDSHNDQRLNHA